MALFDALHRQWRFAGATAVVMRSRAPWRIDLHGACARKRAMSAAGARSSSDAHYARDMGAF